MSKPYIKLRVKLILKDNSTSVTRNELDAKIPMKFKQNIKESEEKTKISFSSSTKLTNTSDKEFPIDKKSDHKANELLLDSAQTTNSVITTDIINTKLQNQTQQINQVQTNKSTIATTSNLKTSTNGVSKYTIENLILPEETLKKTNDIPSQTNAITSEVVNKIPPSKQITSKIFNEEEKTQTLNNSNISKKTNLFGVNTEDKSAASNVNKKTGFDPLSKTENKSTSSVVTKSLLSNDKKGHL